MSQPSDPKDPLILLKQLSDGDHSLAEDVAAALDTNRPDSERLPIALALLVAFSVVLAGKDELLQRSLADVEKYVRIERGSLYLLLLEQAGQLRRLCGGDRGLSPN